LKPAIEEQHPSTIFVIDWGIFDPMLVLSEGRFPLLIGIDAFTGESTPEKEAQATAMLESRGAVFVSFTEPFEQFQGVGARLRASAQKRGYQVQVVRTVYDRHGRAVFEILRARRLSGV
jgi:hypothetical protein